MYFIHCDVVCYAHSFTCYAILHFGSSWYKFILAILCGAFEEVTIAIIYIYTHYGTSVTNLFLVPEVKARE